MTATGSGILDGLNASPTQNGTSGNVDAGMRIFNGNSTDSFVLRDDNHARVPHWNYGTDFIPLTNNPDFTLGTIDFEFSSQVLPAGTFIDHAANGIIAMRWSVLEPDGSGVEQLTIRTLRRFGEPIPEIPELTLNTGFSIDSVSGSFSHLTPGTFIFENPNGSVGSNRLVFQIVPEPTGIVGLLSLGVVGFGYRLRRAK